jgi:predicted PurR-regulated permease PerM
LKHFEKLAPVAAVVSAVSCMACCLPFGFAAAAGAAGLSVVLAPFRPWMLAISGALLIFGLVQLYSRKGTCQRRSRLSMAIFWVCAVLVLAMILMPQVVASLLADRLPSGLFSYAPPAGQPPLAEMDAPAMEALKTEFNRAKNEYRVIALFSPT